MLILVNQDEPFDPCDWQMRCEVEQHFERIRSELTEIEDYHDLIAPVIRENYQAFTQDFERHTVHVFPEDVAELVPEGHADDYAELLNDELAVAFNTERRNFKFVFPNLHFAGVFVLTITVLERWLRDLCLLLKGCCQLPGNLPERPNVGALEKYMKGDAGLPVGSSTAWPELREIWKIRNIFAHDNGILEVPEKWDDFRAYRRCGLDFVCIQQVTREPAEPPSIAVLQIKESFLPHVFSLGKALSATNRKICLQDSVCPRRRDRGLLFAGEAGPMAPRRHSHHAGARSQYQPLNDILAEARIPRDGAHVSIGNPQRSRRGFRVRNEII